MLLSAATERDLSVLARRAEQAAGHAPKPVEDRASVLAAKDGALLSLRADPDRGFFEEASGTILITAADLLGSRAERDHGVLDREADLLATTALHDPAERRLAGGRPIGLGPGAAGDFGWDERFSIVDNVTGQKFGDQVALANAGGRFHGPVTDPMPSTCPVPPLEQAEEALGVSVKRNPRRKTGSDSRRRLILGSGKLGGIVTPSVTLEQPS